MSSATSSTYLTWAESHYARRVAEMNGNIALSSSFTPLHDASESLHTPEGNNINNNTNNSTSSSTFIDAASYAGAGNAPLYPMDEDGVALALSLAAARMGSRAHKQSRGEAAANATAHGVDTPTFEAVASSSATAAVHTLTASTSSATGDAQTPTASLETADTVTDTIVTAYPYYARHGMAHLPAAAAAVAEAREELRRLALVLPYEPEDVVGEVRSGRVAFATDSGTGQYTAAVRAYASTVASAFAGDHELDDAEQWRWLPLLGLPSAPAPPMLQRRESTAIHANGGLELLRGNNDAAQLQPVYVTAAAQARATEVSMTPSAAYRDTAAPLPPSAARIDPSSVTLAALAQHARAVPTQPPVAPGMSQGVWTGGEPGSSARWPSLEPLVLAPAPRTHADAARRGQLQLLRSGRHGGTQGRRGGRGVVIDVGDAGVVGVVGADEECVARVGTRSGSAGGVGARASRRSVGVGAGTANGGVGGRTWARGMSHVSGQRQFSTTSGGHRGDDKSSARSGDVGSQTSQRANREHRVGGASEDEGGEAVYDNVVYDGDAVDGDFDAADDMYEVGVSGREGTVGGRREDREGLSDRDREIKDRQVERAEDEYDNVVYDRAVDEADMELEEEETVGYPDVVEEGREPGSETKRGADGKTGANNAAGAGQGRNTASGSNNTASVDGKNKAQEDVATEDVDLSYEQTVYDGEATYGGFSDAEAEGEGGLGGGTEAEYEQGEPMSGEKENGNGRGNGRGGDRGSGHGGAVGGGGGSGAGGATAGGTAAAAAGGHRAAATQSTSAMGAGAPQRQQAAASGQRGQSPGRNAPGQPREKTDGSVDESSRGGVDKGDAEGAGDAGDGPVGRVPFDGVAHTVGGARGVGTTVDSGSSRGRESGSGVGAGVGETVERGRGGIDSGDARVVDGVDGGGDRARTLFRSGGLSSTATASSKGTHTTGKATAAAASDIPSTGNSGKKTQTQKNSGSKASDAGKPKVPRERTSVSVSVPHADAEYVRESAQAAAIMRALHGMPDEADEAEGAVEADAKKEAAESAKRAVSAVSQGDGDRSDSELLGGSDSPPLRRAKGKGSAKADTKVGKKKASASVEGNVTHAGSGSASSRAQPRGATPTRVVVATREINVAVTAQARVIEQPTPPFGAMGAQAQLLAADLTRALVGQMIQQATQPRALMQVLQRGAAAAAREQRASRADMLGADVRGAGLQGPVAIGKHGEDAGDVAEAEDARVPRNDKNKQRNLRGTPSAGVQRQRGAASDTTTTAATVAAGGVASTAASHAAAARRAALGGAATAEADTEPTSRSDATRIQHQAGDGKTAGSSGNAGSRSNGTDGAPAKRVPGDVSEDADDSSTTSSSDSSSEGESGAAGEEGSDTRYDREPLGGGHTVRTSHNGKGHAGNREGAGVKSSKTTFSGNTKIPKVLVRGLHSMSGDGKSGSGTAASTTPTPVAAASAAAPASGSASAVVAAAPAVKGNVAGVNVRVDDTADARTNNSTNSVAATSSTNATTTSTTSSPAASTPKHDAAKRSDPQASAKKGSAVGALDIAAAVSALTKHMRSLSAASKADSKKTGTNSTSSADTSTATKPASSAGSGAGAARKSTGTVHTPRITPPSTSAAASKASSHASAPSSVLGDARISAALHMPLKVTVPRPQAYAAVPSRAAAGPAIETQPATTGITRGRQTSPRAQKPAQGSIDANGDVAHHAPATAAAPIRASADTWPSQSASAASPYRRLSLPIVLRTRRASAMQQSQSPSMAGARAAANRDDAAPIAAGTGTEATRGAQRHSNKGRSSVTTTASSAGLRASSQPAPTRRSVQVAANPVASAARVAAHATPVAQRVTATFRAIRAQREQRRRASERAQQTVQRRSDAGEVGATQTTKSSVTAPIQAQIESKPAVAAPLAAGLALTQALTSTQSANATTAASISAISGTRVPLRVELLPLLSLEARLEHLVAALEQTSTESVSSKATRTSKEPSVKNAEGQDVLQAAAATLRNSVSSELLRTDRALLLAALQVLLRARTAAGEAITHKTGSDASGQKGDARPSSQTRGAVNVTVAQLRAWATKELSEPRATMPAAVVATRVDELPAVPTNAAALRLALLRRGVDEAVVKAAVRLPGEAKVNKHGVARSDSDVVYMRQNDADTHDIALTLPLPRSAEATVASGAKSVSTPRNNTHEQTSDARHNQRGVRGRVYVPENPFDSLTSGKNTKIPKSRPALPLSLLRFSNGRGAVDEVALMERGTLADIEMYMQHMQEVQATSQGADGARGYARTRNGGLYEDSDQSLFSTGGLTYNFSSSSDTDGDGVYQRDARALSRQLDAWLARSALVNDDDGAMESDEEDSWTREVVPGVSTFTREDADIYRHGRPYDAGVGARDADGEVYRSVAARMAADEAAVRQGYTPRAYDAYASELDMEDEYGGLYNEYGLGDEDGYGVSSEEEVVRTMAEAWGDREERSQRPSALRRRGDSSSGASGSWSAAGGAGTKSNTAATRKAASVSTGSGANGVWDIPASDGIQAPPARSPTRTNTTATKAVENDSSETESEDVFARWLKEKENSLLRRALTGADAVDMGATRADVFSVQDPAAVGEGRAGASASNGGFVYSKYGRFRRLQSPTTTDAPATDSNSTAGRVTSTRASTLATSAETDTLTDALYGLPTSDELNNSVDQRNVGNGDRSDGSNSSANSGKLSQNSAAAAGERRNGAANGNSKGTTVAPAKAAALRSAQPFTATPSHGYGESDARDITATVAQAQQAASSLNPAAAQATPTAAVLVGVQRTGDRSPVGHEGHFTRPAGSRTPLEHEVGTYVGMATDTPPTSSAAITADGKAKAADASAGDNSVDAGVASGLAALRAARYRRHVARYYQQAVQKQGGQGSATGTCASAATAVGESTAGHQRTDGTKASNTAATQGRLASRGAGSNASGVMGGVSGGQRLASIAEGDEEDASANMDTSTAGVWGKSALSAVNPGIGASASRSMLPTQAHGHARTGGAATTTATGSSATAEVAPPPTHAQARARAALQGSNTAPADRRGRGNTPQKDVQAQDTRARREAAAVAAIASLRNTNADTNATTTAAAAAASSSSVEVPVKSKFATNPVTTDSSGSPPLLPHPGVPRTVVHGLCLWRLGSYAAFYHHHLALQQGIRTHAAAAATLSVAPTTRTVLPPPHSYAGVVMARLIDGDLAFIREGTAACDAAWTAKVRERDEQRRRAGLTSGGAAEAGVAQKEAARDSDVTADAAVSSNDTVAARMTAPSSAHAGTPTNTPGAPPPPAVPPRLLATLTAACARVRNVLQLGYHSPVAAVECTVAPAVGDRLDVRRTTPVSVAARAERLRQAAVDGGRMDLSASNAVSVSGRASSTATEPRAVASDGITQSTGNSTAVTRTLGATEGGADGAAGVGAPQAPTVPARVPPLGALLALLRWQLQLVHALAIGSTPIRDAAAAVAALDAAAPRARATQEAAVLQRAVAVALGAEPAGEHWREYFTAVAPEAAEALPLPSASEWAWLLQTEGGVQGETGPESNGTAAEANAASGEVTQAAAVPAAGLSATTAPSVPMNASSAGATAHMAVPVSSSTCPPATLPASSAPQTQPALPTPATLSSGLDPTAALYARWGREAAYRAVCTLDTLLREEMGRAAAEATSQGETRASNVRGLDVSSDVTEQDVNAVNSGAKAERELARGGAAETATAAQAWRREASALLRWYAECVRWAITHSHQHTHADAHAGAMEDMQASTSDNTLPGAADTVAAHGHQQRRALLVEGLGSNAEAALERSPAGAGVDSVNTRLAAALGNSGGAGPRASASISSGSSSGSAFSSTGSEGFSSESGSGNESGNEAAAPLASLLTSPLPTPAALTAAHPLFQHWLALLSTPPPGAEAVTQPREVVARLDDAVVGQAEAKRAVAIALRNRLRRARLGAEGEHISPKNMLMVGPTGSGKTELARTLARITKAPFVKVEATKYTETGFHGKDVDSIVKDLVDAALALLKGRQGEERKGRGQAHVHRALASVMGIADGEWPAIMLEVERRQRAAGVRVGAATGAVGNGLPAAGGSFGSTVSRASSATSASSASAPPQPTPAAPRAGLRAIDDSMNSGVSTPVWTDDFLARTVDNTQRTHETCEGETQAQSARSGEIKASGMMRMSLGGEDTLHADAAAVVANTTTPNARASTMSPRTSASASAAEAAWVSRVAVEVAGAELRPLPGATSPNTTHSLASVHPQAPVQAQRQLQGQTGVPISTTTTNAPALSPSMSTPSGTALPSASRTDEPAHVFATDALSNALVCDSVPMDAKVAAGGASWNATVAEVDADIVRRGAGRGRGSGGDGGAAASGSGSGSPHSGPSGDTGVAGSGNATGPSAAAATTVMPTQVHSTLSNTYPFDLHGGMHAAIASALAAVAADSGSTHQTSTNITTPTTTAASLVPTPHAHGPVLTYTRAARTFSTRAHSHGDNLDNGSGVASGYAPMRMHASADTSKGDSAKAGSDSRNTASSGKNIADSERTPDSDAPADHARAPPNPLSTDPAPSSSSTVSLPPRVQFTMAADLTPSPAAVGTTGTDAAAVADKPVGILYRNGRPERYIPSLREYRAHLQRQKAAIEAMGGGVSAVAGKSMDSTNSSGAAVTSSGASTGAAGKAAGELGAAYLREVLLGRGNTVAAASAGTTSGNSDSSAGAAQRSTTATDTHLSAATAAAAALGCAPTNVGDASASALGLGAVSRLLRRGRVAVDASGRVVSWRHALATATATSTRAHAEDAAASEEGHGGLVRGLTDGAHSSSASMLRNLAAQRAAGDTHSTSTKPSTFAAAAAAAAAAAPPSLSADVTAQPVLLDLLAPARARAHAERRALRRGAESFLSAGGQLQNGWEEHMRRHTGPLGDLLEGAEEAGAGIEAETGTFATDAEAASTGGTLVLPPPLPLTSEMVTALLSAPHALAWLELLVAEGCFDAKAVELDLPATVSKAVAAAVEAEGLPRVQAWAPIAVDAEDKDVCADASVERGQVNAPSRSLGSGAAVDIGSEGATHFRNISALDGDSSGCDTTALSSHTGFGSSSGAGRSGDSVHMGGFTGGLGGSSGTGSMFGSIGSPNLPFTTMGSDTTTSMGLGMSTGMGMGATTAKPRSRYLATVAAARRVLSLLESERLQSGAAHNGQPAGSPGMSTYYNPFGNYPPLPGTGSGALGGMTQGELVQEAIRLSEREGIVFLDEIDKICVPAGTTRHSGDASDEGVQRDLLPIIEGSTVTTPHGPVNTSKILFIAAGAFHQAKPSDLLPELQGRLPIRITLSALTVDELYKVLCCTDHALLQQHAQLFRAEGVRLLYTNDAILALARAAVELNKTNENIGARRLHGLVERVLEEASFDASEWGRGSVFLVTQSMVEAAVASTMSKSDLKRYCL